MPSEESSKNETKKTIEVDVSKQNGREKFNEGRTAPTLIVPKPIKTAPVVTPKKHAEKS